MSQRKLKEQYHGESPPDGYRWTCPSTGFTVRAVNYWNWIQKGKDHLKANNHPIPSDLAEQMEAQLCTVIPPQYCEHTDGTWVDTRITWDEVKRGTIAILTSLISGFVEPEEADRRANICVSCPYNIRVPGCSTCRASQFVVGAVAKKKTQYDDRIHNCGACRCVLSAKVWIPKSTIDKVTTADVRALYPSFCWAK